MITRLLVVLLVVVLLAGAAFYGIGRGWFGRHEGPGEVTAQPIPAALVAQRAQIQLEAARARGVSQPKQILFGDLHVHSTFSFDAYMLSLPMLQGEGAHPPADACDFARFCSALDFWSLNDHAEGLSPRHWRETVETIRQCNAVAGSAADPDVVAYLGWEWTQVGSTPETHYGHKNVVLAHTEGERIPARPIASRGQLTSALRGPGVRARATLALAGRERRYLDFAKFVQERADVPACADGVDVRELPAECMESVETPGELFAKLDQWNVDAIVIPHGTTWGFYTPPGSTWDKQLSAKDHDPARQTLIEVFSGHGNSEEYRDFRAVDLDAEGNPSCPEPQPGYLPSCYRAGEIIRSRCLEAGLEPAECAGRAAEARQNYVAAGVAGHLTVPGAVLEDWLDSGQCRSCFQPAFNYRPGSSVQYIMALRQFAAGGGPDRFRFGFMASSDVHTGRPGTGYKEYDRREMTEATGGRGRFLLPESREPAPRSEPFDRETTRLTGFQLVEGERQVSFFLTGGLVAVHADGRDRESIWQALDRREVYGTSGPRILLWFDLLNPPGGAEGLPMGSAVRMRTGPEFSVRAVGSLEQQPGCPEYSTQALSPERLHHLCRGECYNPGDQRRKIERIEVVRIRPRTRPDEPMRELIEDPWRVFACQPDASGCSVRFSDPEFPLGARDVLYYVRAIEEPSLAVNAANLRCEYDAEGNCVRVNACATHADYQDDCLATTQERAWSSPIFVDFEASAELRE